METVDEHGDIVDSDFADTLAELLAAWGALGPGRELVLVVDIWSDECDLRDRGWAYVEGGKLPAWCLDASDGEGGPGRRVRKVPQRFHRELAAQQTEGAP
jgi:hypothetical protein